MPFSGSYGSISSSQQSVDGSTPQDYEVPIKTGFGQLDVVSATMQKQAQDDSQLTVQIVSDGQVKKEASTTAQFGVVNVTWNTNE